MQIQVFDSLRKISFFSAVTDEVLHELAAKAKYAKFLKNATIISEGDETTSLYVLLSGRVRVFSSFEEGREITLLTQEAGSYFGELALLTQEPRSASVITLEKTECGVIAKADFLSWLQAHPDVAITLLGVLSEKIRTLTERVKQLALSNVYERTVRELQLMARKEGEQLVIENMPTQQELANIVGASREMINKIIKGLIKGGYIAQQDKALVIVNKLPNAW